ncbi:polyphenol oxidase family protein [Candidatus Saccharibacteria bacterium]|nr:polyphenol oxidase family protein [Candidatus Saccharibacteria bacterium]
MSDGNMAMSQDLADKKSILQNRSIFLTANDIAIQDTTRVKIVYEGDDYLRYHEVTSEQKGGGMFNGDIVTADALVTREPGQALFLPLADCVGAVIFDPNKQILMLSHIGRHSLEQNGGHESVKFLVDHYGCNPNELSVWLTPAPGKERYPLFAFDNRSFKDIVFEQLQSAGISTKNIVDNPTDTTKDARYFSHSEFLKGNRPEDGRYAIVAVMKA